MSDRLRIAAAALLIVGILLTPLACLAALSPDLPTIPTTTTETGATTP
jgi:hypothetical protein